ncbi:MAG: phytanoyl-CoA dioxygenase family protein [Myxococcaceae bacterium]
MIAELETNGFTWARGIASNLPLLETIRGGLRNGLDHEPIAGFTRQPWLRSLVTEALGPAPFCVRAIVFDKKRGANWGVAWHQDLAIAVHQRAEVPGFGPWSVKAGVPHALAPDSVLTRMVATRIHLDDCGPTDGPLRVIAGSHRRRLDDAGPAARPVTECVARRGDVLLLRPLLLHSSAKAAAPSHRRVLHLEWSNAPLPAPLRWRWHA